jgi:hypothetical protein
MPSLECSCRSQGGALMVFPAIAGLQPGDLRGRDLFGGVADGRRVGPVFLQGFWASAPMPQGLIGEDHSRNEKKNEERFSHSKNVSNVKGSSNAHP